MGAYSNLDIEMNYENDPFEEDESFVDESFEDEAQEEMIPSPQEQPAAVQTEADPAPAAPAAKPADTMPPDEEAKRKAHEEAEVKRKAEWEAKHAAKRAAEQAEVDKVAAMSDDDVLAASLNRVSGDTEKLTRRNMMECVMEHIQTMCLGDPTFARKVMHPRKNMIRCYQYINRHAWEYVQDEVKARGITPGRDTPSYASSIPDGVCYQWAVDYFNDPEAKEDYEKEEQFVPQPYRGTNKSPKKPAAKGKSAKKGTEKKSEKKTDPKPKAQGDSDEQMSLLGVA